MKIHTDGTFLSVPCPGGQYSCYSDFCDAETAKSIYIIQGDNGYCAAGILERTAREAEKRGVMLEKILSVRNPGFLEALALPEQNIFLLDASAPGLPAVRYPAAVERIVNVQPCYDRNYLARNAGALRLVGRMQSAGQRRSINYLTAVRAIRNDTDSLLLSCVDKEKIRRYASRFAAREFPAAKKERSRAKQRFLSAITAQGVWAATGCLEQFDRVIAIDDGNGVASTLLIGALRREAEERGLACTVCRCQTNPAEKNEHILIPEAGIAFFTANRYHPAPPNTERVIHMTRFLDRQKESDFRFRLSFHKKAARELINEAVKAENTAKELRDMMSAYYENALSEDALQTLTEGLLREIF